MMEKWVAFAVPVLLWIAAVNLELCASLNEEGRALLAFKERVEVDPFGALSSWDGTADDPCLWFGVGCSDDGKVVALILKDLYIRGTLASEIGELTHIRSIILHNNSFYGGIPGDIGKLQNLEVLDLGQNNLSGALPYELGNIPSLQILVLGGNKFTCSLLPHPYICNMLLKIQVDKELSSFNRKLVTRKVENATIRRLLASSNAQSDLNDEPHPFPDSSNIAKLTSSSPSPSPSPNSSKSESAPSESPADATVDPAISSKASKRTWVIILAVCGPFLILITVAAAYFLCYQPHKVVSVMLWRTGLSGQLQKAFVTGVPSLRRCELEAACEHFSNIIGSLSNCTLYKGTLSSGVEIAVISTIITSAEDWTEQYENRFRKKISTLSKVNHKNFMNLLGYCEEEEPLTRMMVLEYAPNGTLFEHLHIKEAEQLDWAARLRVIMGVAYCLEYLEQLDPPLVIRNLTSSSIYLTEDYAAKFTDLEFCNEEKEADLASESLAQENVMYKFGIVLLEVISGRLPFSEDDGLLVLWASTYLAGKRPLMDMVDQTLNSVCKEEDITKLVDVVRTCINASSHKKRPTMAQVTRSLRMITSITPEEACPRLSPLWWAELEILSH